MKGGMLMGKNGMDPLFLMSSVRVEGSYKNGKGWRLESYT